MKRKNFWMALVALCFSTAVASAKDIRVAVFRVSQMHCENCVKKVSDNIRFEKGMKAFDTNLKEKTVTVTYDAEKTSAEKLAKSFEKIHYEAELVSDEKKSK